MKMRRLEDTNVEERLEAYLKKKATMTERLQQELDSYNYDQMYREDGTPIKSAPAGGIGKFRVSDSPYSAAAGREIAIVTEEATNQDFIVDPFTAIYQLQQLYPGIQEGGVSPEDVKSALQLAAADLQGEMEVQDEGMAVEGSYSIAATLHAEDRIHLDALIRESASTFDEEPTGVVATSSADILAQVSMEDMSMYPGVDPDASYSALLKSVQSSILDKYPDAFVDVIEGPVDHVMVRTDNAKSASRLKSKLHDIIDETRRNDDSWVVFEGEDLW